jgi:iron(III) transport system substrate-binding protein
MKWLFVFLAVVLITLGLVWWLYVGHGGDLTLYCAQDEPFARELLEAFRKRTGLRVTPKFDTEKNKSVSLYQEIVAEKDRPRCDVFWNNEILGTIRLQRQGMLEPYASPSTAALRPFPASAKTDDHTWHAFATRARVLVVNTKVLPNQKDWPRSLLDLTDARFKGKVVMAKPQFGTSATQAACLFEVLGGAGGRAYYRGLKANGVQVAPGNRDVASWVGAGQTPRGEVVAVGITDTDDASEEIRDGSPVVMIFPDRDGGDNPRLGTLYIPNTVSIIKGTRNPEGARKLVDYLLSAEVEGRLAEGDSRQIPFNPDVRPKLPKEIETPPQVKAMDVDFSKAADLWEEVQAFLREEFGS